MIKFSRNYIKITGVTLMAVLALGIGGTGAAVRHRMALKNEVRTPTVEVTTTENIGDVDRNSGKKQKEVMFKNTGSADVFLRIAYAETWVYTESLSGGKTEQIILPNCSEPGNDDSIVSKEWHNWNDNWYDGGDGWYYYKKVLEAGKNTEEILRSVTFNDIDNYPDSRYADAEYQLHFQVEAVQASDELQVSKDAVKELFDKSISIDENGWLGNKYTTTVLWEGGN